MQPENKSDFTYKILFLGESDVGKTSIILRYTDDFFELEGVSTYGIDLRHKYIKINNKKIRLDLWDTAGQERFKTITKSYYTKAKVIIFTFDLTSFESFKQLKSWINESKEKTKSNIDLVLCGHMHGGQMFPFTVIKHFIKKKEFKLISVLEFVLMLKDLEVELNLILF